MDLEIITSPAAIEWRVSNALVPYAEAVAEMERRIAATASSYGTGRSLQRHSIAAEAVPISRSIALDMVSRLC